GTFSYRRQPDLRARRFSPVGSIGDLATLTSYRVGGNRSARRCPGGHGARASDEVQQSRYGSPEPDEFQVPYLGTGLDAGPATHSQGAADGASAELDEKERLSSFG